MLSVEPTWRPGASFYLSGWSAVEHKNCQHYSCSWALRGTLGEPSPVVKSSPSGRTRAISVFFYYFLRFFLIWTVFKKSLLNLLQYCLCFIFWFSDCEACGILALSPGIKPVSLALEGKVLTSGLPGKSPLFASESSLLLEATQGIFPGDYLAHKVFHKMVNSFRILLIGLLPEEVTVFSLPCKQQVFNDESLYSHLNASDTSLKWEWMNSEEQGFTMVLEPLGPTL